MSRLKPKEIREQNTEKLRQTLYDLRSELSKLRSEVGRGLVKKDTGKVRKVRREIAMVLTVMRDKGVAE